MSVAPSSNPDSATAATPHSHPNRVEVLSDRGNRTGAYVLYWMQGAQRAHDNHALEYAVTHANQLKIPPLVVFCLVDRYPEANVRHYQFMLEGLLDVQRDLRERGITFLVVHGDPPERIAELAVRAALVVTDRAYLRVPKLWRAQLAERINCSLISLDTNLVVPVRVASTRREYAARTIRPKIRTLFREYCRPVPTNDPHRNDPVIDDSVRPVPLEPIGRLLDSLELDANVPAVSDYYVGGSTEALGRFRTFLSRRFFEYATMRNEPKARAVSAMSPYLHFGQISPIRLALEVWQVRRLDQPVGQLSLEVTGETGAGADGAGHDSAMDDGLAENKRTYLEELCVRRELAHNFVEYEPNYDSYDALPEWARITLEKHRGDRRPARYDEARLDAADTNDPYWNAAMQEMKKTGFMHNYLRMYWGKQIITWTEDARSAFEIITRLNNRYFLDGRDPNSYTNVAWIFGLHDRPWPERDVFGTVRTMNANVLRRKCDMEGYIRWVQSL